MCYANKKYPGTPSRFFWVDASSHHDAVFCGMSGAVFERAHSLWKETLGSSREERGIAARVLGDSLAVPEIAQKFAKIPESPRKNHGIIRYFKSQLNPGLVSLIWPRILGSTPFSVEDPIPDQTTQTRLRDN